MRREVMCHCDVTLIEESDWLKVMWLEIKMVGRICMFSIMLRGLNS